MPFQCSICDEPSTRICVRCTKDACDNHICEKCLKCSDCCECEVALDATPRIAHTIHTPPEPELQAEGEAVAEAEDAEDAETEPESAPLAEPPVSDEPTPDPTPLAEPHPPDHTGIVVPGPEGQ